MTKPFDVDEIAKKQQIIDGSKRFFRMIGDVVELGKALEGQGKIAQAVDVYQKGLEVAGKRGQMEPFKAIEERLRILEANKAI